MCSRMYLCDTSSPFGYLLRCAIAGFSNSLIRLKILICIAYVCDVESVYLSTFSRSGLGSVSSVFTFWVPSGPGFYILITGCFGIMILFDILNVSVFCLHVFLWTYVQCLQMARRGRQNPPEMVVVDHHVDTKPEPKSSARTESTH